MTTTVADSIRSKIGKPKKENANQESGGEKDCRIADQPIGGRTLVRAARPPVKVNLPGGRRDAEAWAAARSRIGAALIPCRKR
jgi:hypothetical protein